MEESFSHSDWKLVCGVSLSLVFPTLCSSLPMEVNEEDRDCVESRNLSQGRKAKGAAGGYSESRLVPVAVSQGYIAALCDGRHSQDSVRLYRAGSTPLIQMGMVVTPGVGSG